MTHCAKEEKQKKIILVISIVLVMGMLVYFKYASFISNNFYLILHLLGLERKQYSTLNILLPVGISFFTFQTIGYCIDVYRGDVECQKNIFVYALFVSFFPQLVAGPIERSKTLLQNIKNLPFSRKVDYNRICNGFTIILWGYFLKLVIADRISILVDYIFEYFYTFGTIELVIVDCQGKLNTFFYFLRIEMNSFEFLDFYCHLYFHI